MTQSNIDPKLRHTPTSTMHHRLTRAKAGAAALMLPPPAGKRGVRTLQQKGTRHTRPGLTSGPVMSTHTHGMVRRPATLVHARGGRARVWVCAQGTTTHASLSTVICGAAQARLPHASVRVATALATAKVHRAVVYTMASGQGHDTFLDH